MPDAKVLAAVLKTKLYDCISEDLRWVAQFAYQPGRDFQDALARVHRWIRSLHERMRAVKNDRQGSRSSAP